MDWQSVFLHAPSSTASFSLIAVRDACCRWTARHYLSRVTNTRRRFSPSHVVHILVMPHTLTGSVHSFKCTDRDCVFYRDVQPLQHGRKPAQRSSPSPDFVPTLNIVPNQTPPVSRNEPTFLGALPATDPVPEPTTGSAALTSSSAGTSRWPGASECQSCGCSPATPVRIRRLFGLVLVGIFFWRTHSGPYCRDCGLAEYNTGQHITATIGLCGYISAFLVIPFLLLNRKARHALLQLPPATHRDPNVYTGSRTTPRPPGKPVARRVTAYLPAVVIVTLLAFLISNPNLGRASPQELAAQYTGSCWTQPDTTGGRVKQVSCNSSDAQYVAIAVAATEGECPNAAAWIYHLNSQLVACLVDKDELDAQSQPAPQA